MSLFFKKNREDKIMKDPSMRLIEAISSRMGMSEVDNERFITSEISFFRESLEKHKYISELAKNCLPTETMFDYHDYVVEVPLLEYLINELEKVHESNDPHKIACEQELISTIMSTLEPMENYFYELKKIMKSKNPLGTS